jgi:predicted ATPase
MSQGFQPVDIDRPFSGEAAYVAGNPRWAGSSRLVVVSGCSGGGKSSLLDELARRGYAVFPEPGRQIVKEQLLVGGNALPWSDAARFVELCISRAMYFYNAAQPDSGPVFFDRSIVDAVAGLARAGLAVPPHGTAALRLYRYAPTVFLVPPWQELFAVDAERRHGFEEAVAEYRDLEQAYPAGGYAVISVPRSGIRERADFVEREVRSWPGATGPAGSRAG